jgi:hypothetical protein
MDRSAGPALRWLRALLVAVLSVAGAAIGHVSADGLLPGWGALATLLLVSVAVSASVLGRPATTARVVTLLVAGQTFIHAALTAMAGHKGDPARAFAAPRPLPVSPDLADTGRRVGSLYDQLHYDEPALAHMTVPSPVQHLLSDLTGANALMALAHLAAAAAVGLWLAMGERALWTVLALTSDRFQVLVRAIIGDHSTILRSLSRATSGMHRVPQLLDAEQTDHAQPKLLLLSRAVVRRGPPRLLAA